MLNLVFLKPKQGDRVRIVDTESEMYRMEGTVYQHGVNGEFTDIQISPNGFIYRFATCDLEVVV